MDAPLNVLSVGRVDDLGLPTSDGSVRVHACASLDAAALALAQRAHDALLIRLDHDQTVQTVLHWPALSQAVLDTALLVVAAGVATADAVALIRLGVQDVLRPHAAAGALPLSVQLAVQRKRIEIAARGAHALDLATGLPNHAQLLEHMSHLLALREREPAPMALLALRLDGLHSVARSSSDEAANVLRRKAAVRLRAGLRASDVVAALGGDTFAVLLAWIDAPADAQRVATKLSRALQQPFNVAGQPLSVAVSLGLSQYPEHGKRADELLHRALGQAATATPLARAGYANFVERGSADAANDED